jgi:hypothetical protein
MRKDFDVHTSFRSTDENRTTRFSVHKDRDVCFSSQILPLANKNLNVNCVLASRGTLLTGLPAAPVCKVISR